MGNPFCNWTYDLSITPVPAKGHAGGSDRYPGADDIESG